MPKLSSRQCSALRHVVIEMGYARAAGATGLSYTTCRKLARLTSADVLFPSVYARALKLIEPGAAPSQTAPALPAVVSSGAGLSTQQLAALAVQSLLTGQPVLAILQSGGVPKTEG